MRRVSASRAVRRGLYCLSLATGAMFIPRQLFGQG